MAITLDTSSRSLVAKMTAPKATTNPQVVVAYAMHSPTAFTEFSNVADMNGTSYVEIVPAPISDRYIVRTITIHNCDTVTATVVVEIKDGSSYYRITKFEIPVDGTLVIDEDIEVFPNTGGSDGASGFSGFSSGSDAFHQFLLFGG